MLQEASIASPPVAGRFLPLNTCDSPHFFLQPATTVSSYNTAVTIVRLESDLSDLNSNYPLNSCGALASHKFWGNWRPGFSFPNCDSDSSKSSEGAQKIFLHRNSPQFNSSTSVRHSIRTETPWTMIAKEVKVKAQLVTGSIQSEANDYNIPIL